MKKSIDGLKIRLVALVVAALSLGLLSTAHGSEVDPLPNVAYQSEISGTRIWSQPGVSQSTYEATTEYLTWISNGCPAGSGNAGGVDMNFTTDRSDDRYFNYCTKTWRSTPVETIADSSTATTGYPTVLSESSTPVVQSESSTPIVQSESSTPVVTPTPAPARITSGLGGYAVVHPDGHVCGVIVATSTDPFGNGGYMPQEYMGCPSGARIVFQTTPSESGNVAGWHGPNVIYNGSEFVINNGPSSTSINNGVAIESNGRSWDTGTGRVITPGVTDTRTVLSETTTVIIDTPTVVTETVTAIALAIPVDYMAGDDIDSLPEIEAEVEISNTVEAKVISGKTRIAVVTEWVNTKLSVTATRKGSKKKFTYRFTTNSEGEHTFRAGQNLKGFTLVLYKGTLELDRDFI